MYSTKSESDDNFRGPFKTSDHLPACKPYKPYGQWWLCNHEQISFQERLHRLEVEVTSTTDSINQTGKFNKENQSNKDCCRKVNLKTDGSDQQRKVVDSYVKLEQHSGVQDLNAIIGDDLRKMAENKEFHEYSVADTYSMGSDVYSSQDSQQSRKLCSDLDPSWIGVEKTEPWWRTAERGDLASVVTCETLEHFESCDLPSPQKPRAHASASMNKTLSSPSSMTYSPLNSDNTFSDDGLGAEKPSFFPTQKVCNPDVNRVQLLEALCHSQTRAREAEKFAQQAYDEKEQITKLYFRQASHLFAYRQWVDILHLENLCHQLKSKGVYISTQFPVLSTGRQLKKDRPWTRKKKVGKPRTDRSKWFFAFAVGLGLVGAGLLLGWTIGWLFPTF